MALAAPASNCRCYRQWCRLIRIPDNLQADKVSVQRENKNAYLLPCWCLAYGVSYQISDLTRLEVSELNSGASALAPSDNLKRVDLFQRRHVSALCWSGLKGARQHCTLLGGYAPNSDR
ncbi:hypothetical protein HIV01_011495 [Lysobacter arenosi]|uniref:Uncharacterized protein n=1 Tax=Lysobacter arenosi TaxID=2795387 RepID=A0ABX7R7X8_9GAMM|nr:hypothetical protein [Lysobacter arenosi]QSX73855.1 hypothetical protein HIV01_011495 [Lysobacter arenosi]